MTLSNAKPLRNDFRVCVVNRKPGLEPGESFSDITAHLATGIEADFDGPVFLAGTSTGGSMALQLALDRPDLVKALVVIASAYRLGPNGKKIQQDLARLTRAGNPAEGWARMGAAMMPAPLRRPLFPVAKLVMGSMAPDDPSDMLVTVDAEDAFDIGDRLDQISAPTLVIGGAKDPFYTRELFERTAAGVQNGRAFINAGWGHGRAAASSTTANIMLGFLLAAQHT